MPPRGARPDQQPRALEESRFRTGSRTTVVVDESANSTPCNQSLLDRYAALPVVDLRRANRAHNRLHPPPGRPSGKSVRFPPPPPCWAIAALFPTSLMFVNCLTGGLFARRNRCDWPSLRGGPQGNIYDSESLEVILWWCDPVRPLESSISPTRRNLIRSSCGSNRIDASRYGVSVHLTAFGRYHGKSSSNTECSFTIFSYVLTIAPARQGLGVVAYPDT